MFERKKRWLYVIEPFLKDCACMPGSFFFFIDQSEFAMRF